jgi:large subunit ribosomal protein L21
MFAIVATSGKQFRVSEGDRIVVDRLARQVGDTVRLDSVLLLGGDSAPVVGTPFIAGASVEATVLAHRRGEKVVVLRYKSKKRERRKSGHRRGETELRIGAIHTSASAGEDSAESGSRPRSASGARTARSRRQTGSSDAKGGNS